MRERLGVPGNTERVSLRSVYAVFKMVGCNRLLCLIRNGLYWINRGLTTKRANKQVRKWANGMEYQESNKINKVFVCGGKRWLLRSKKNGNKVYFKI